MSDYIITTDTACDLPEKFVKENELLTLPLYYQIDDVIYGDEIKMEIKEFYKKMREGAMPTTMGTNPEVVEKGFKEILEQGKDILHISFASSLSVSYNSSRIAEDELKDKYPDRKIVVIDSKSASLGEGMVVYYALKMQKQGKTLEEVACWINDNIEHFTHKITVDNLFHLQRGGRVSKTTAVVGTLIHIKPVLNVNNEGRLISYAKVRGRKKSIDYLCDEMEKTMGDFENKVVFIGHGDREGEAQYLADKIKANTRVKEVIVNTVSPTIGSHAGPGLIALFYMGTER